jgi:hypothetical protein
MPRNLAIRGLRPPRALAICPMTGTSPCQPRAGAWGTAVLYNSPWTMLPTCVRFPAGRPLDAKRHPPAAR